MCWVMDWDLWAECVIMIYCRAVFHAILISIGRGARAGPRPPAPVSPPPQPARGSRGSPSLCDDQGAALLAAVPVSTVHPAPSVRRDWRHVSRCPARPAAWCRPRRGLELQTKAIRRFPKISQSRRRPLLGPSADAIIIRDGQL